MKYCILSILMLINSISAVCQSDKVSELDYLGDIMINAAKPEHRIRAHQSFLPLFRELLQSEKAFELDLSSIQWISEQMPADRSFRLLTWQLIANDDDYRYFGFILKEDGTLHELFDNKSSLEDVEYSVLEAQDWYGVLYYGMKEYELGGKNYYLLTGYNGNSQYEKIKTAEVLYFDEKGTPVFGKECFRVPQEGSRDKVLTRILLSYSADSNVTLRYNDNLGILMHDHLIRRMSQFAGQGPTYVSDGSYEGYELKDGEWIYNEKIFHHKFENFQAPRPKPIFGN